METTIVYWGYTRIMEAIRRDVLGFDGLKAWQAAQNPASRAAKLNPKP